MSIPGTLTPLFNSGPVGTASTYQISRSLRFNSSDSAYLSRTPSTAGNRKVFTWAGWIKRCKLDTRQSIFSAGTGNLSGQPGGGFFFESNNTLYVVHGGGTTVFITSAQVFRDTSAWFHLVVAYDTTQGTASDRVKVYVNGSQIDISGSFPDPNLLTDFNNTVIHAIGSRTDDGSVPSSTANYYLAEVHFIDGAALTPSSFTETDATTGQLVPKTYTGEYGTNGFKLTFSDNSNNTAITLGKDTSGRGNNWTPYNIAVSASTIYSSTWTHSGTGSPSGVQDPTGTFSTNSPTVPDNSQISGRAAYVNHTGGTSFLQFNPSPALTGSSLRVFTYQPQGTSGADTWININGGSDLRPWRVSPNYTGWSNAVVIPGGLLTSLRVSLSYGGGSAIAIYAIEIDGVVLKQAEPQDIDSLVDTPTNYGTDTYVGGEVRGNYCTLNPLASAATLADGNLNVSGSTAARGTIGVSSGKWYYEITLSTNVSANPNLNVGVIRTNATSSTFTYDLGNSLGALSGDVIGVALDVDAGRAWIAKNNIWVGSGNPAGNTNPTISSITLNNDSLTFFNSPFNSVSYSANFGQRPFAYTAPSGFKALCTQNLPEGSITTSGTFTGNSSADGPFVYLNGVPTAMTINGNAVTFGTHADKLSNGFKVRNSTSSYNTSGSNTYSISSTGAKFKVARAQANP
jgi:hypothetical protein